MRQIIADFDSPEFCKTVSPTSLVKRMSCVVWLLINCFSCSDERFVDAVGRPVTAVRCDLMGSYIERCEELLGISPLVPAFDCDDGEEIPRVIRLPDGSTRRLFGSTSSAQPDCINPTLLSSQYPHDSCHLGSKVQVIQRSQTVETDILCRKQSGEWRDVAAITRDRINGITCFSQIAYLAEGSLSARFDSTDASATLALIKANRDTPDRCLECHSSGAIIVGPALIETSIGKRWVEERREATSKSLPYQPIIFQKDLNIYKLSALAGVGCGKTCHSIGSGDYFDKIIPRAFGFENWRNLDRDLIRGHGQLNSKATYSSLRLLNECGSLPLVGAPASSRCWQQIPMKP